MNLPAAAFLLVVGLALLILPRHSAPVPLLVSACYMTVEQRLDLGPFSFTIIRILLLLGIIRVVFRREWPVGGAVRLDWLIACWGLWAVSSSVLHNNPSETLINRLGMVYNICGVFFLFRCFCRSEEDAIAVVRWIALILVPVAVEMLFEQFTHRNLFSLFGGVEESPAIREGRLRSQGPFLHSILAGTVGAVCAPLMAGISRRHSRAGKAGLAACVVMVFSSASGGPLVTLVVGAFALCMWRWRNFVPRLCFAAVGAYFLLDIIMNAPAYYLIARIPLDASTTWHRAALIEAAIVHLSDWWIAGTDYTRHWMPYGVPWSENHVDITNHYIAQGVRGGLPLMLLFIAQLWCGFRYIGEILSGKMRASFEEPFLIWSFGASLFAYSVVCLSVALFDQSVVFLYLILACLSSTFALYTHDAPPISERSAADEPPARSANLAQAL